MSAIFDKGPFTPCPRPFNMASHVLAAGAGCPDKAALCVIGRRSQDTVTWSYGQLERDVFGLAAGLQTAGLRAGDRVLLRLGNSPWVPIAYLAAIAIDALPVPLSAQLTSGEISKIVTDIQPRLVLHDASLPCPDHPGRIDGAELADLARADPVTAAPGAPDRPAYIVFTSGTSGQPRAVLHAHRAIWARQMMLRNWYDLQAGDRILHAGAFNWTYTMGTGLMDPWSIGATALIPAADLPVDALPDLFKREEATIFAAAPGVYRKLLKSGPDLANTCLRHGLSAGEKMSPALMRAWKDATGTDVHEAYGMSECSTFVSACPARPAREGTSGSPQPGRKLAILDSTGLPCPRGQPGEIAISRDDTGLMLGYLNAPDDMTAHLTNDWFLTGDRGILHDDDQITLLGRGDDMMNAGGFRVSPIEVETVLATASGIGDVAVTEIEIKEDARVIVAFYTGHTQTHLLEEFARARLAAYKCPRAWVHVPHLPAGANGKLKRADLATLWRAQ